MKSSTFDILFCLALILIGGVTGFFIGRGTVKVGEKTEVEYKALPIISVTVTPEPARFTVPQLPLWIWRTDTVVGTQVVDTAAILADWIVSREYSGRLIDDSTGAVDYSAVVQYNKLQSIGLDYTPMQRTVTTTHTIERRFIPFIMAGGNSAGFGQVEAGTFIGRLGISVEVGSNFNGSTYFGAKAGFRF